MGFYCRVLGFYYRVPFLWAPLTKSFFRGCFRGSFKGSFKGIRIEGYFIATLIEASNIVASVTLIATLVRMSSWKPL